MFNFNFGNTKGNQLDELLSEIINDPVKEPTPTSSLTNTTDETVTINGPFGTLQIPNPFYEPPVGIPPPVEPRPAPISDPIGTFIEVPTGYLRGDPIEEFLDRPSPVNPDGSLISPTFTGEEGGGEGEGEGEGDPIGTFIEETTGYLRGDPCLLYTSDPSHE